MWETGKAMVCGYMIVFDWVATKSEIAQSIKDQVLYGWHGTLVVK